MITVPETKKGCAGEDQQQFTGLDWMIVPKKLQDLLQPNKVKLKNLRTLLQPNKAKNHFFPALSQTPC
jgi:hypothetical protein